MTKLRFLNSSSELFRLFQGIGSSVLVAEEGFIALLGVPAGATRSCLEQRPFL